jgi:hypothetical protein
MAPCLDAEIKRGNNACTVAFPGVAKPMTGAGNPCGARGC